MSAQSPGALGLSALLHGGVIALVLFFSLAANNVVKDEPKVLELVAGAGDNYAATEAPALGSPGGVKLQQPRIAQAATPPAPQAPAKPEPSPIQPAPEAAPAPTKAAKTAKPPRPVDLVAELKRVQMRRELNLERKYNKEREAELKREAAAAKADRVAHIDAEGIRQGVLGGSTSNKTGGAGGNALTREEGSQLEAYFQMLTNRVRENAVPAENVSDKLEARVEFFLAADGSISHVHILNSSGNADFDHTAVEVVAQTQSIGPRPDGRSDTQTILYKSHTE